MRRITQILPILIALALCARAHAQVTFAQFDESTNTGTAPFSFTNGDTTSTFSGTTTGNFTFFVAGAPVGPQAATITLSSSAVTPATALEPFLFQPIDGILNTLTITRTSDNANLLTVAFTGTISGFDQDVSATLSSNTATGNVVTYSSDFLNFSGTTARSMGLFLSGIDPGLSQNPDNQFLDSFVTDLTGSFSSDLSPVSAVPEPSTWLSGILALATLGAAKQRKRATRWS